MQACCNARYVEYYIPEYKDQVIHLIHEPHCEWAKRQLALQDEMDETQAAMDWETSMEQGPFDLYCDYCEEEGHTFKSCPNRDDDFEYGDDIGT